MLLLFRFIRGSGIVNIIEGDSLVGHVGDSVDGRIGRGTISRSRVGTLTRGEAA